MEYGLVETSSTELQDCFGTLAPGHWVHKGLPIFYIWCISRLAKSHVVQADTTMNVSPHQVL